MPGSQGAELTRSTTAPEPPVPGAADSRVVRDERITAVEGLEGKRVAVPFGSTTPYTLPGALRKAGPTARCR